MKQWIAFVFALVFVFCLTACGNVNSGTAEGSTEHSQMEATDPTENLADTETAGILDHLRLDRPYVEIRIYTEEQSLFSNRNKAFFREFTAFWKDVESRLQPAKRTDAAKISVSIDDGKSITSLSVYEGDVIEVWNAAERRWYACEGVYEGFTKTFEPFLTENRSYCRSACTPVRNMYEYVIYDQNGTVLESDYISREPHLFYDSGIVHLWIQAGTGTLTRGGKFFDVKTGRISPEYYGQTDFFGDKVCATGPSEVTVYEMFSGEPICVLDHFEQPLADCLETILSARFSEDGTQITVEYLNADFEEASQIFLLP